MATVSTAVETMKWPRSNAEPGWTCTAMPPPPPETLKPVPLALSATPESCSSRAHWENWVSVVS